MTDAMDGPDLEPWERRVITDLGSFADSGFDMETERGPEGLTVTWASRGVSHSARFRPGDDGDLAVVLPGGGGLPTRYADFLASSPVADLQQLAQQILTWDRDLSRRTSRKTAYGKRTVASGAVFVPAPVQFDRAGPGTDADTAGPRNGLDALRDWIAGPTPPDATRILFLTAQAGQGKSRLLRELARDVAQGYRANERQQLLLYVDAQGSGLARLDQAIAKTLDDLRSPLAYPTIQSLVREGLIVLVIDGFDELIGARGTYEDAFSSLSAFVHSLDGRGTVVAAARSAYFAQEYRDRAGALGFDDDASFELSSVSLVDWDAQLRAEFRDLLLDAAEVDGTEREGLVALTETAFASDGAELSLKPLFARDLILLVLADALADDFTDESLVDRLVRSFLEREITDKLLDGNQRPLLTYAQLLAVYAAVAQEMWLLEARELLEDLVRMQAELVCDDAGLDARGAGVVVARSTTLPLLRTATASLRTVTFEHEIFFAYFLAVSLASDAADSSADNLRLLLGKAAMTPETATFVAAQRVLPPLQQVLDRLAEVSGGRHPRRAQIAENCGLIAGAAIRKAAAEAGGDGLAGLRVNGLTLAGVDLRGVRLTGAALSSVVLYRCDLSGARLLKCTAEDLLLQEVLVDPTRTRLELAGLGPAAVHGLQVRDDDVSGARTLYDPKEVAAVLVAVGALHAEEPVLLYDVPTGRLNLVEALCAAYERVQPLGDGHSRHGWITQDPEWKHVRDALIEQGLVTVEHRSAGGAAQTYFRKHFAPADLMAGLSDPAAKPQVKDFWADLSA